MVFGKTIFRLLLIYATSLSLYVAVQKLPWFSGEFFYTFLVFSLVFPAGFAIYREGGDFAFYGIHGRKPLKQCTWAILTSIVVLGAFSGAYFLYLSFFQIPWPGPSSHPLAQLVYFHLILVGIPEEFLFRGYIQTSFTKIFSPDSKGAYQAIFATSILFALAHALLQLNLTSLNVFFPSLIFGWLRMKTKSIWPSVFLHGISNVVYIYLLG